jgi:hypothetical protein
MYLLHIDGLHSAKGIKAEFVRAHKDIANITIFPGQKFF